MKIPLEAITAAAVQHSEYRGFGDPDAEDMAIAEDMLAAALPFLADLTAERAEDEPAVDEGWGWQGQDSAVPLGGHAYPPEVVSDAAGRVRSATAAPDRDPEAEAG